MPGVTTSVAEVTNISGHGFWLLLGDEELSVPYAQFPWFKKATIEQLLAVERPTEDHLYWPQLDVDLSVESLRNPDAFPLVSSKRPQDVAPFMRMLLEPGMLPARKDPAMVARLNTAFGRWMPLFAATILVACASPPERATDVLSRASQAMGAAQVKSLRYTAEGEGFTFGQAFTPSGPWPKVAFPSVTRTMDYEAAAMRDEVVLSRAEPRGGGGYPLSGPQRNDQFVRGDVAWNVVGSNVAPGPRFVADRMHQLAITPHGVLKAAMRNNAILRPQADGSAALSFTEPGRYRATVTVDAQGLVTQVESMYTDPVLGDTPVVTTYSGYRSVAGVQFPTRIRQTGGGLPVLDLTVKDVQVNVDTAALAMPEAARNQAERVTTEKVTEGVWFVAGGSHNSVAIEMADHLVLVETPLNDARTQAVIDAVKPLAVGKPIRYAINSHAHFDHSGGVRTAAAEGATIVTHAANVPYFERVMAQANTIRPDRLAQSGRKPVLQAVGDRSTMADASRTIELHRIVDSVHNDGFLMVYLPKERLLIQADAYTPGLPNAPAPAVANLNNLNLIDNLERLKLSVDRILPLHGRVVPLSELYAAVGKPAPR